MGVLGVVRDVISPQDRAQAMGVPITPPSARGPKVPVPALLPAPLAPTL